MKSPKSATLEVLSASKESAQIQIKHEQFMQMMRFKPKTEHVSGKELVVPDTLFRNPLVNVTEDETQKRISNLMLMQP